MVSKKRKLLEFETKALIEQCSVILLKKLPPKLKNPGNFKIPCSTGQSCTFNTSCNLGASVNLMPLLVGGHFFHKNAGP